jgi:hypothetical protein
MTPTTQSIRALRAFAARFEDCNLVEGKSSIELVLRKGALTISVMVPLEVYEWYVDVKETSTALQSHDWYDYAGYESNRGEDLDRAMAQDLTQFLENILVRPLRMRESGNEAHAALDWWVQNSWRQCVPATGE